MSFAVATRLATIGPVASPTIRAGEEGVLPAEGDRPDGSLDDVRVQLDPAILEEQDQTLPVAQGVADRLGQGGAPRDPPQLDQSQVRKASIIGLLRSCRTVRRSSAGRPRISASSR